MKEVKVDLSGIKMPEVKVKVQRFNIPEVKKSVDIDIPEVKVNVPNIRVPVVPSMRNLRRSNGVYDPRQADRGYKDGYQEGYRQLPDRSVGQNCINNGYWFGYDRGRVDGNHDREWGRKPQF